MPSWIVTPQKRPEAIANLLVVPHAGGSANFFHKWIKHMPDAVELHLVEMPGRGRRMREPLSTHWRDVTDAMLEEIALLARRPFAVFGHSMGAHLAYRVLSQLDANQSQSLLHFFPSASKSPLDVMRNGFFSKRPVSDDDFVDELRALGGAAEELLLHPEFLELVLQIMRADYLVCDSLADAKDAPALACNITALGGRGDPLVGLDRVAGWQSLCQRRFELVGFDGGHFFFDAPPQTLPALLTERLLRELATASV